MKGKRKVATNKKPATRKKPAASKPKPAAKPANKPTLITDPATESTNTSMPQEPPNPRGSKPA
jgi:hypothetical protein